MTKQNEKLNQLPTWQALTSHHCDIAKIHMRQMFMQEEDRFHAYSLNCGELLLDYSRNRINFETVKLLCQLADEAQIKNKINALFAGLPVNRTENRSALHTALRDQQHTAIMINGQNIALQIQAAREKTQAFCLQIQQEIWRGVSGKPIKHVVNIGIGGSHLGPQMACYALKEAAINTISFHFIASIDDCLLHDVLTQIDPEATLFIISSKTFTTLETLTNAHSILAWMRNKFGDTAIKHHFIAVTANANAAQELGIPEENIFPIWDWVNGRYSIWSAIGLPLQLMIGNQGFDEFLAGGYAMDQHFRQTPFSQNMPALLALLGIWYNNFFATQVQAIIPYSYRLRYLIAYLQQAEMESNGKSINLSGEDISYPTGSVIFGEEGSSGQHSYHQLLHQGQHLIPVDFILVGKTNSIFPSQHRDILVSSGLSQAQALMRGKTFAEAKEELLAANHNLEHTDYLAKHKMVPGNRPSNVLFLNKLTPKNLGTLLALYEHKIFVQGALWDINSFDQWGVELGKQLLPSILKRVRGEPNANTVDCATAGMINHIRNLVEET